MKIHRLWLMELFIWLAIILIAVLAVRFYNVNKIAKESTYHIFIQDIDGLMKGSPVKIMGVQVGYITEINIFEDYMYVSFVITKKDVKIPHGARALIESYGIAGSKSIELYPPEQKANSTQAFIFVKEPIRASDAFRTQNAIAKTLITVSNGTTAMLDSKTVAQHKQNIQRISQLSGKYNFDNINEKSDEMIEKMREKHKSPQNTSEETPNE